MDVDRAFLATESHGLLRRVLTTTAVGGMLIAAVALALAAWTSRRITAPVTRLTEAARTVARRGDSTLLPVASGDELGQMSAAFNRMTTALQTQRDLRRRLIDDLSHELNTPLSVIQLEAKGLLDGLQEPAEGADRIIREVTMLRNLVRDLNWAGGNRLGRTAACPGGVFGLGAAQRRVAAVAAAGSDARDRVVVRRANRVAGPRSRPGAHEPGARQRDTQRAAAYRGRWTNRGSGRGGAGTDRRRLPYRTDGAGIDAADLPHLFDRLYRADQSRTRGTGGSGLGLAIARAILTAHSGTIAVTSGGPGTGTTVRFSLPCPA